jgi:hypothetical protein
MNNNTDYSCLVAKVWNYAHVLRDQGIGYGDYVEQNHLELQYRHTLENLAKEKDLIGTIFRGAQNKLTDPETNGARLGLRHRQLFTVGLRLHEAPERRARPGLAAEAARADCHRRQHRG